MCEEYDALDGREMRAGFILESAKERGYSVAWGG